MRSDADLEEAVAGAHGPDVRSGMARKRKTCKACGGAKKVHTPECFTRRAFDVDCDCGNPPCQECGGTGIRERRKGKLVRQVMDS